MSLIEKAPPDIKCVTVCSSRQFGLPVRQEPQAVLIAEWR